MATKEQETPCEKRTHRSVWPYGHQKWPKRPRTEKNTSSISPKPGEIESWLLLNVNGKSWAACHSPSSSASFNHRKGPKWSPAGHIVSPSSGRYRLFFANMCCVNTCNNAVRSVVASWCTSRILAAVIPRRSVLCIGRQFFRLISR